MNLRDQIGRIAGAICAIHCLLVALLPALAIAEIMAGQAWLEKTEVLLTLISLGSGGLLLWDRWEPVVAAALGALFLAGIIPHDNVGHSLLLAAGGLVLARQHHLRLQLSRTCCIHTPGRLDNHP